MSNAEAEVGHRPAEGKITPEAIKALRDYMSGTGGKKGRLIVLMDVVAANGQMVQTGLEPTPEIWKLWLAALERFG